MTNYSVIIRGPAGVGKTTLGKMLAKKIKGYYISVDKILKKHKLDYVQDESCISEENCLKSNELILLQFSEAIKKNNHLVIEGCFYHKSQLKHLLSKLPNKSLIFTLKAELPELIKRDKTRKGIGIESIKAVHKLSSQFDYGIIIDTNNKTKSQIIKEMGSFLPR
ncbi:MAG: AAA family ATPase [Nanoarchaeota archaeon]|nr:AAA family ATPase [Nanoarchaeota archaeon]